MSNVITMPAITVEVDAVPTATPTLGRGGEVASRVTVGRSDVWALEDASAADLAFIKDDLLLNLALRVSFRPAVDEQFDRVLVSVLLQPTDPAEERRPIARRLAPAQLYSGPFSIQSGVTFGVKAAPPGAELKLEASDSTRKELRQPYVIAAGEGESDPEWRYQRTETMVLEGAHEMAMIVQSPTDLASEVFISVAGTVARAGHRTDVTWEVDDAVARVPLIV